MIVDGRYELKSKFNPAGDQQKAIDYLTKGIKEGKKFQTLLGATGTGKTFTMANVIKNVNKPTIILAHNKTLAGQLYSEFKEFFPNNRVEYFVSYYNHYQPESYKPGTDTYIEKDASINQEIEKLRHSATSAVFESNNVIIISSVSCIYGLGDPIDYKNMTVTLRRGIELPRDIIMRTLVEMQYSRNEVEFKSGMFRAKGDVLEIYPSNIENIAIRVDFFGDEIDEICQINPLTGKKEAILENIVIYPNSHYVADREKIEDAILSIKEELEDRYNYFVSNNKLIEAQRINERTNLDLELLKEIGFCKGIENYSRHITKRKPGEAPFTLLDYLPKDYLLIIDESHVTIPQVGAMYNGDRARKENLVDYGFRLPSAFDNRPLRFEEFEKKINQCIFVSATPSSYEEENSKENVVEQIIRPTGLLDPKIVVRPIDNQIDDLVNEIHKRVEKNERVLVTSLTIEQSEKITKYLEEIGIKAKYLHSKIQSLERLEIIRDLRVGKFDVLVGINLLREGLDIPEVSLVGILNADTRGFLRSEKSLVQTIGRAARNTEGTVIMYADEVTDAMYNAINETNRRREIQEKYNKENNIVPKTIKKDIRDLIKVTTLIEDKKDIDLNNPTDIKELINKLTDKMIKEANNFNFEEAAKLRDQITDLNNLLEIGKSTKKINKNPSKPILEPIKANKKKSNNKKANQEENNTNSNNNIEETNEDSINYDLIDSIDYSELEFE